MGKAIIVVLLTNYPKWMTQLRTISSHTAYNLMFIYKVSLGKGKEDRGKSQKKFRAMSEQTMAAFSHIPKYVQYRLYIASLQSLIQCCQLVINLSFCKENQDVRCFMYLK